MSTNFYSREDGIHIGKKSIGWEFLFSTKESESIFSIDHWIEFLINDKWFRIDQKPIMDEYGNFLTISEFFKIILSSNKLCKTFEDIKDMENEWKTDYFDNQGYWFTTSEGFC